MCGTKAGKKRKIIVRGIARVLTASLLFGVVGSHADGLMITAQAAEVGNTMMDGDGIVSLGTNNSAVIRKDGSLWIWGSGRLGNGTTESSYVPIQIMTSVKTVSLGPDCSAAIKTDNSLWTWGGNNLGGQLGNGTTESSYVPIQIMEDVKAVSVGGGHCAAIKTDGSLWTWGANSSGQLGNGTGGTGVITENSIPVKIMEDVKLVSLGSMHSAAIKTDGSLWMWGNNEYGQLGNGDKGENITVPIQIMENVRSVSLGREHSAAIKTDGSLWIWGNNDCGQLGDEKGGTGIIGSGIESLVPIQIMENVKSISLGDTSSAIIKTDGSLWMWGSNSYGELGNGTKTDSLIPIQIVEDVRAVSISSYNSAIVKTDGSLWIWGGNHAGQLGNGMGGWDVEVAMTPYQLMPPGSIPASGSTIPDSSEPDDPDDPDNLDFTAIFLDEALIKVVDADGKPIKDVTVSYNQKQFTTSNTGLAVLDNYQTGNDLVISKAGYVTKQVPSFIKRKTGTTYVLSKVKGTETGAPEGGKSVSDKLANLAESVYLIKGNETIDLLTQKAQINTYYNKSLNSSLILFDIICNSQEKYDYYTLYSGDKRIRFSVSDGKFLKLRLDDFVVGKPVSIGFQNKNKPEIKKELNIQVVNISPPVNQFYLGRDGLQITIPENVPIVGGEKIVVELDDLPAECNFKSDGTVQIGFNIDWLMKEKGWEFNEIFPRLKGLKEGNVSSFLGKDYTEYSKSSAIKPDLTIIGYAESNQNNGLLQGKLFVEVSFEYAHEQQLSIGPVPVVVEISIEGKVNADGSVIWSAVEGWGGSVGFGGGLGLGVYGGVGIAKVASAGIYGDAEFGLHYVILPVEKRKLDKVYISGALGLEGKVLGKSYKCALINGTWYIIGEGVTSKMSADQEGWEGFAIDDYSSYNTNSRSYLTADGTMPEWKSDSEFYTNGSIDETILQSSSCLDTVPQVIRMGDTVMLFYLTDAGTVRNAANRSMLVYSLWDETKEEWGEPKALLDDGTADYSPDFYTDGEKIYAVWQDAKESLSDDLSLEETAKQMTLHAAVYDAEQKQFVDLGAILSENDLFQQRPQIVADDNGVSVYWYENAQDNVLGLSGSNRIYRASLTDQNVLTEGIQVMSVSEEEETEDTDQEEPLFEESDEELLEEESVSENTATAFREFVALTEEVSVQETLAEKGSVSDNTIPEDGEENDTPTVNPGEENEEENENPEEKEPTEGESSDEGDETPEKPEETVSDNSLPEESVSENTILENTIQVNTYNAAKQADQPWTVTFLQAEENCILSADAGRMNGKAGYAFVAGTMDQTYNVKDSKVAFIEQGQSQVEVLGNGTAEKVEFSPVYADETLTWFEAGDIHYIDGNRSTVALFGESRIPSWSYTLLSDGTGPEVFFPVNVGGKSNLYRISRENGTFLPSLQVTEQDDYIQYVDGFVRGGETILVYNKMKVNDKLEEVNNSLCTGKSAHSYYDIAMQSAGSMVLYNEETDEYELEIAAQLYNNGTVKAEGLSLSLYAPDGSVLESVPVDTVLESGETDYTSAVFSLDLITQEAEYTITLSGTEETNKENNSVNLTLGSASLQVEAKVISVADTRTIQAGIQNTGVTAYGGTVSVRDSETGKEYASGNFEPIEKGKTVIVEVELAPSVFREKEELALEVVVIPDQEKAETVRDFVKAYIPSYEVNFVTDAGISTAYADYGTQVTFPKNPTKEGKYFIGWYDAENPSEGTYYSEEMLIKKDLTLYAYFADEKRTQIPLSECSVSQIPMQFYTGGAIKPKLTVKWGSEILSENKDYKVMYQNNKEQGTASAIITAVTGKGKKYTGSIERSFSIMYPASKVSVKAIPAVNFTGENHTPEPVVTYQKKTLVKDKDYTVNYFNNRNAGTAGVTITGKGTFSGTKTVTFQIKGTAITGMVFEKIPDVSYIGSAIRPIVTVKTKDGIQLQAGADYRLVYENTVNKGTATVTVVGNGNYTGTKKLSYKVVAKPLTEAMISGIEDAVYTGSPIKPAVTVKDGGAELAAGKDYTVSYSKNKAVGTATVTVKGKGNYSGTVKLPFAIGPMDLVQAQTLGKIEVRVSDIAYTGKALKPVVQVYEVSDGEEKKIPAGGYALSYADNVEKGIGTVTVTGKEKSGYTGTVTAQFRIVEKARLITASTIKIDAIPAQTFTGARLEPAVRIVDKSEKTKEITLVKDTDYEVTYKNSVNAGKAVVTVKGIGSYAGSKNVTYKIGKRAVGNKTVLGDGFEIGQILDEKYTGYALKPDVVVKDQGKTLILGTDYKLSYRNNTKIGTASVTLTGMGNYSGSYNAIRFNIVSWDYNDLQARIEDQVYTGKVLKPQVTFYTGGETVTLKPGTAVKVVYKDNKNAGTATVTITGNGELKKMAPITVSFEIEPADITAAIVGRIPNQTLKGVAVKPIPKVKVGKNALKAGRDFTVSYLRNGVKGEAEVIIAGIGNYTGECSKSFIVQ